MTALLVKLGKKIAAEVKDPANKHNPKVLLDIKLFLAVKDAVEKTQGLMMAGSIAIKRAKTEEEKDAVQAAVKKGMGKVEATLKSKMQALEKQALMIAVAQSGQKHEEADSSESEDAAEEKKAPSHKKVKKDDDDEEEEEDTEEDKAEVKKAKKVKKDDDDDDEEEDTEEERAEAKKVKKDDDDDDEEEDTEDAAEDDKAD